MVDQDDSVMNLSPQPVAADQLADELAQLVSTGFDYITIIELRSLVESFFLFYPSVWLPDFKPDQLLDRLHAMRRIESVWMMAERVVYEDMTKTRLSPARSLIMQERLCKRAAFTSFAHALVALATTRLLPKLTEPEAIALGTLQDNQVVAQFALRNLAAQFDLLTIISTKGERYHSDSVTDLIEQLLQ